MIRLVGVGESLQPTPKGLGDHSLELCLNPASDLTAPRLGVGEEVQND